MLFKENRHIFRVLNYILKYYRMTVGEKEETEECQEKDLNQQQWFLYCGSLSYKSEVKFSTVQYFNAQA